VGGGLRHNLVEVEPGFGATGARTIDRTAMVRSERRHALSGPAIAMLGDELVPVEDVGDEIVVCDEREMPDGIDNIGRGAVTLPFPTARLAQLGNASLPRNYGDSLRNRSCCTSAQLRAASARACAAIHEDRADREEE
jgi:hypothetical protein